MAEKRLMRAQVTGDYNAWFCIFLRNLCFLTRVQEREWFENTDP